MQVKKWLHFCAFSSVCVIFCFGLEESSINRQADLVATVEEGSKEETFGVDDRDIEEKEEVDEEETNGEEGEVDASEEEDSFLKQPIHFKGCSPTNN